MAYREPDNIIASSLDNFLTFYNSDYQLRPYVTITVPDSQGYSDELIMVNANDDSDRYIIEGGPGLNLTSQSYNTDGDQMVVLYNLLESIKQVAIVYNAHIVDEYTIEFEIDSSKKYNITSDILEIGGNYNSYRPDYLYKYVVLGAVEVEGKKTYVTLEKYNNSDTVTFNVSAPFNYTTTKYPYTLELNAYKVLGNTTEQLTINNQKITILPTTLTKFETVDYNDYYIRTEEGDRKKFLTTQNNRYYNYGEVIGLSILTDHVAEGVELRKRYYTNGGEFLMVQDGTMMKEGHYGRIDFYDTLDISNVEAQRGAMVGYVDVTAVSAGKELTEPVTYRVMPKCNDNQTLFFLNKLGGLDSFTFLAGKEDAYDLTGDVNYFSNPLGVEVAQFELEFIKQRQQTLKRTLVSQQVDRDMARWLSEMAKSHYVFKFLSTEGKKFMMVVIDDMPITINSDDTHYQVKVVYHDADNTLPV